MPGQNPVEIPLEDWFLVRIMASSLAWLSFSKVLIKVLAASSSSSPGHGRSAALLHESRHPLSRSWRPSVDLKLGAKFSTKPENSSQYSETAGLRSWHTYLPRSPSPSPGTR
ncbi:hypothetical protein CIPAW_14G042200 [Carya illinoinensis]|uniref:Uncharacterized protein n=1 Tax=Carya illinoinensis TaxID=32201 RepID=A0A8T1NER3_CARIL|nr:hypothetical protein CIPAW_14G042200 [Carya illinoinensis]